MRHRPARSRNGLPRTPTHRQRRNRWLLWGTVLVLAIGGNRWVAGCQRVHPVAVPAGAVRVVLGSNKQGPYVRLLRFGSAR